MADATGNLIDKVKSALAAEKLFPPAGRILVAVSGGVDSMVLLHLLHRLAPEHQWHLIAAHFNHRLRGMQSDADEKLARRTARGLHLPILVGAASVRAEARRRGWSLEMAARHLRHQFLARAARRAKCPLIALAHHRDDQIELFFLRLLRGAGPEGLAGMKSRSPSPADNSISLLRPLLGCSKEELRQFAADHRIAYAEDATNASLEMMRNRIRHNLLPLLRAEFQPALDQTVLRTMELIAAESDAVRALAGQWLASPAGDFAALPLAVQRRVLQSQLFSLGAPADYDLIERLRQNPREPVAVAPGKYLERDTAGLLRLQKAEPSAFLRAKKILRLAAPSGSVTFAGITFAWEIAALKGAAFSLALNTEQFDADNVGDCIILRHWRPGDRFQPIGTASPRKLQDLFTNLKAPQAERRRRVVAAAASGEILWVQGLRIGENFKLHPQTRRRLVWRWREKSP